MSRPPRTGTVSTSFTKANAKILIVDHKDCSSCNILLLILLDVGAAIIYAVQKDYKKAVYWLAAAVLNVTVTF